MAVGGEDQAITGVTNRSAHGRNLLRPAGLPLTRAGVERRHVKTRCAVARQGAQAGRLRRRRGEDPGGRRQLLVRGERGARTARHPDRRDEVKEDVRAASVLQLRDDGRGRGHVRRPGCARSWIADGSGVKPPISVSATRRRSRSTTTSTCPSCARSGCSPVWHDDAGAVGEKPACVEFSFKYGDDQEDYRGSVARDAHDVLQALGQLPWVHPKPTTKTALVYR